MPKKRHGGAIRPSLLKVGDSPVAGLKLRHCLSDVLESKFDCAWSPDGRFLAFVSKQHSIQTFDVVSVGTNALAALGDDDHVFCLAWSADSKRLAGAAGRKGVSVWDAPTGERIWEFKEHTGWVGKVACSHEGGTLASGSQDQTIRLWDMNSGSSLGVLQGHTDYVNAIAWSPDDRMLASGSADRRVALWDPRSAKRLGILEGATEIIVTIAFSHDGRTLAVGNGSSIHLWDIEQRHLLTILEGHTGRVELISFSSSGKLMASISGSGLLLWRTDTWSQVAAPQIEGVRYGESALAFHPHMPILATATSTDSAACIWDVDERLLLGQSSSSVHYATAKLVLVGDSGVGKTGLGWRLAHDEFKEHASTHGQQFWTVPRLGLTRKDGTECEAVLWDLAGQPVYRSVHSIFLEDLHASLILFDPTNRHEPLKGAQFWLEQLKGKQRLPPSVLVGARVDRGAAVLPQAELDQFCQQYGISGGYIGVSAKSGEGLDRLVDVVRKEIDWDRMTATVTTETFKRIKDYVLALKEDTRRASALVQPQDLRNRLQGLDASWEFTDLEMMTALGHLQNHGYVTILRSSPGQEWVLLAADLLASLASSIVILADKNPRELGAVSERELLENRYQFPELAGLDTVDQQILIDAAVVRFLQHSVCFRETFGDDTLLIFPGLIKQKRPLQDETRLTDDVSYVVRGKVENIYASLVVLLGYTPSFNRVNQWQHHTQYVIGPEEICGFRMIEEREGEIELVLYYGEQMHVQGRRRFQKCLNSSCTSATCRSRAMLQSPAKMAICRSAPRSWNGCAAASCSHSATNVVSE